MKLQVDPLKLALIIVAAHAGGCSRLGYERQAADGEPERDLLLADGNTQDRGSSSDASPFDLARHETPAPLEQGLDLAVADGGLADLQPCAANFSAPTMMEVSLTDFDDWAPSISGDNLTLFFSSWRPGGLGGSDLWSASRTSASVLFDTPVNLSALNSSDSDAEPCISGDNLTLIFTSTRPGGLGSTDFWITERALPDRPFGAPSHLDVINSSAFESGCSLDQQANSIIFSSVRTGGQGGDDLWGSLRPDRSSPFAMPQNLAPLNTPASERGPTLSADGREIYFSSDRSGGSGMHDIWRAVRSSPEASFGTPALVPQVNSAKDDANASLSTDGLSLYYNYNTTLSGGDPKANIWVTTRSCAP